MGLKTSMTTLTTRRHPSNRIYTEQSSGCVQPHPIRPKPHSPTVPVLTFAATEEAKNSSRTIKIVLFKNAPFRRIFQIRAMHPSSLFSPHY